MFPMISRHSALLLSSALLLTIAGCGGKGQEVDTASTIADPNVPASQSTSTSNTATNTTSSTAAPSASPTTPTPTAPVKAEGWGTLKGRVVFDGDAPAAKVLVAKGDANAKDAAVCAVSEIKSERLIVDPASKGVKNVIVYLYKPSPVNPEAKSAKGSATVMFDQKKCIFEPHVLAVMADTKVELKSSDPVSHNVNCKLPNNSFNDAIPPSGSSMKNPKAAERQPGVVTCDIHPWMMSYWLVLDHPYFAVTDDKGNFEIKNAPAGTQKVIVWQEATKFVTPSTGQDVVIAANGDTNQEFQIKSAQVKPEQ